jgi:hypothetical protein
MMMIIIMVTCFILDGCLSRSDFTHNWQLHFHDTAQNAHAFFDNLDMNVDHSLCETEVVVVLLPFDNVGKLHT